MSRHFQGVSSTSISLVLRATTRQFTCAAQKKVLKNFSIFTPSHQRRMSTERKHAENGVEMAKWKSYNISSFFADRPLVNIQRHTAAMRVECISRVGKSITLQQQDTLGWAPTHKIWIKLKICNFQLNEKALYWDGESSFSSWWYKQYCTRHYKRKTLIVNFFSSTDFHFAGKKCEIRWNSIQRWNKQRIFLSIAVL